MVAIFAMPERIEEANSTPALTSVEGPLDAVDPLPTPARRIQPTISIDPVAKPIKLARAVHTFHQQPSPVSVPQIPNTMLAAVSATSEDVPPLDTGQEITTLTPMSEPGRTSFEPQQPRPTLGSKLKVSGSAWILYRPNSTVAPLASVGQLGGSQAGLQVSLPVAQVPKLGTVALRARLSRALQTPGQAEAGIGVRLTLHPKIPLDVVIERRIRIGEGGRNAFAVGVASGFDDKALPRGVLVSAYGQAGVVGLRTRDLYVDAAIRAEHRLFTSATSEVRVGVAAWGAAQPGVSRIDVGPRISGSFRIGGARLLASVEWRERFAGNARPNSRPVFTIGSDF